MLEPHLHVTDAAAILPPALQEHLLSVAREAVANAVRHARANRVWVTLETAVHDAHLRVVDDGVGFAPIDAASLHHGRLRVLREQTRALGGTLVVESAPGQGTAIDARLPIAAPQREEAHV